MPNPIFKYLDSHRDPSDRYLFNSAIGPVKQYVGAEKTALPIPEPITQSYSEVAKKRKSVRDYAGTVVDVNDLAAILYWSMSEQIYTHSDQTQGADFNRRPYPSGGAKFSIDAYVLTDSHGLLGTAIYHYRPDTHVLELVKNISNQEVQEIKRGYLYEFVTDIPVMILFSYIMERNVPKYGTFGTKLALIEAGHIAQNMAMVAQSTNVDSIMLAGGDFELMDNLFGFDSYNESTFYTVGLGKKPASSIIKPRQ